MDNTAPNYSPVTPPTQTPQPPIEVKNKSSIGGVIGIIIIIAVIILGGLYFWGKRIEESRAEKALTGNQNTEETTPTTQEPSEADSIQNVTSSDSIDSIDADLKATNTSNLDAELQ